MLVLPDQFRESRGRSLFATGRSGRCARRGRSWIRRSRRWRSATSRTCASSSADHRGGSISTEIIGSTGRRTVPALRLRTLLVACATACSSFDIERNAGGAVVGMTFYGRGWGHGVGMCQVGAYGMALEGATFEEILKKVLQGHRAAEAVLALGCCENRPARTPYALARGEKLRRYRFARLTRYPARSATGRGIAALGRTSTSRAKAGTATTQLVGPRAGFQYSQKVYLPEASIVDIVALPRSTA